MPPSGDPAEILARIRRLVDEPSARNDPAFEAALSDLQQCAGPGVSDDLVLAHLYTVHYFFHRSDLARALVCAIRTTELAKRLNNPELLNRALRYEAVIRIEGGDFCRGVELSLEALDMFASGHAAERSAPWTNLGAALFAASQNEDAMRCFRKGAELAAGMGDRTEWVPHMNMAECALRMATATKLGLAAAERAIALNRDPTDANERETRARAECLYIRLLLTSDEVDKARLHVADARRYCEQAESKRADLSLLLAEGLLQIRLGDVKAGTAQLSQALELSRQCGFTFQLEAVAACVAGYEQAGQPDVALEHLQEWMKLNQDARAHEIEIYQRMLASGVDLVGGAGDTPDLMKGYASLQGQVDTRLQHLASTCINAALSAGHDIGRVFRVARLADMLCRELGWSDDEIRQCSLAAKFCDIGMIAMPDVLLAKPAGLTAAERGLVNEHTRIGAELLAAAKLRQLADCIPVARFHHEAWDGSGPEGLSQTAIPLQARVVALCDSYDSMTHARPWRAAITGENAIHEIEQLGGTKFDPQLATSFAVMVTRELRSQPDFDGFLGADAASDPYVRVRSRLSALAAETRK